MPSTIGALSALRTPVPVASDPVRPRSAPTGATRRELVRAAPVGSTSALQFSEAVRTVVAVAHRHRLRPPVFRSPPTMDGVDRTIRRRDGGSDVVAVRRAGRPLAAVRADVVDGVVAANGLTGAAADRFRHDAWSALESTSVDSTIRGPGPTAVTGVHERGGRVELDDVA